MMKIAANFNEAMSDVRNMTLTTWRRLFVARKSIVIIHNANLHLFADDWHKGLESSFGYSWQNNESVFPCSMNFPWYPLLQIPKSIECSMRHSKHNAKSEIQTPVRSQFQDYLIHSSSNTNADHHLNPCAKYTMFYPIHSKTSQNPTSTHYTHDQILPFSYPES